MTVPVYILGAGMHPWGKWGRNFVEYGLAAAARRPGRGRPGLDRHPVRGRRRHHPQRLPGLRGRCHLRPGAGLDRCPVSRPPTPPAPRAPRPSTTPGPRSWPGCATWPWWSGPTPRPRASSPRWAATARTTRTGCASTSWAPPTRPTSRSTPGAAWSCSGPPRPTSPRSR